MEEVSMIMGSFGVYKAIAIIGGSHDCFHILGMGIG